MKLLKSCGDKAMPDVEFFFNNDGESSAACKKKALLLKDTINAMDGFIQQHTSEVCPRCQKVCCINRHGYYDYEDLVYIYALGLRPPEYREGIEDAASCQFISRCGCTIERALRPFRCNWYFCDELIHSMEEGPAKPYREFISRFQKAVESKQALLDKFFGAGAQEHNFFDKELPCR